MKPISGKWAFNPKQLGALVAASSQPINFKIDSADYSALSIDVDRDCLKCYPNVWTSHSNDPLIVKLDASDRYHSTQNEIKLNYAYPIYYGQLDKDSEFESIDTFESELLPCANIEISSIDIASDT